MKALVLGFAAALGLAAMGSEATACPDWRIPAAAQYNATGSQLRQPAFFNVVAGGDNYI